MAEYNDLASAMRDRLNQVSPSFCLAKWNQVSLHLPQGMTQSCYHPPAHPIPLDELAVTPAALHNTIVKIEERRKMKDGLRPEGCSYCWKMEDSGDHLSDRHYRSSEWWAEPDFDTIANGPIDTNVLPRYVEVNFNQACNFRCAYCSPHLSTTWEDEIKEHGPYQLDVGAHNDISSLQAKGLMPLKVAQKDNSYVTAFWKWWPTIYRNLRVFRMTGGEPLMDRNTFEILDFVNRNPHGKLELSITSNLCPPDQKLFDRFIAAVQKLEEVRVWEDPENFNDDSGNHWYIGPAYRHFTLFVSLDGVGKQAEYIRTGLDYELLLKNVRTYLSSTRHSSISFINTFNLLGIPTLQNFAELILTLRQEFGGRVQEEHEITPVTNDGVIHSPYKVKKFQRVWFDLPILHYPPWLAVQNSGDWGIDVVSECLEFMKQNVQQDNYLDTFEGFKPYEILKVERNLAIMREGIDPAPLEKNMGNFHRFIDEFDRRRGTSFKDTFPELAAYYNECASRRKNG